MNLEPLLNAKHSLEHAVVDADTARAYGSGGVDVLATPALIALMEGAARDAVQGSMPLEYTTVGSLVSIRHLAPTPIGQTVWASATVIGVEGRRIVFRVEAHDAVGPVAEGTHERMVVDLPRFVQSAEARSRGGAR